MSGFVRTLSPEALRLLQTPFARITNPDVGFQLSVCVNPLARAQIMMAIRSAITAPVSVSGMMVQPVPASTPLDIRFNCLDGERIGVWFPTAPQVGRDEALRLPSRLLPGENYLQTLSLNGIRFVANNVWNSPAVPKRFPLPDPFADARLTSFDISLAAPNRVVTRINGVVPIAVLPDVTFTITFTDTLMLDGAGNLVCMPGTPQVNVTQVLLRPLLGNVANVFANAFVGARARGMVGLGCAVIAALAPGFIDPPVGGRISFPYSRVNVDSAGVILGSRAALAPILMMARVMEEPFRAPR